MIKEILLATAIVLFPITVQADGMYAGLEAGGSFGTIDVSKNPVASDDDNVLGYNVGAFFGYEKDLNIAIAPKRGKDAIRMEGLLGYRDYNYDSSRKVSKNVNSSLSSDVSSISFIPGIHYDAKSLYLMKNDKVSVYPTASVGVGFSYNRLRNTSGTFNNPSKSVGYNIADNSDVDFAWYAGLGLKADVNNNWGVEVGYRYIDLGSVDSGDSASVYGYSFKVPQQEVDLTAHEVVGRVSYKF